MGLSLIGVSDDNFEFELLDRKKYSNTLSSDYRITEEF
jgi:hypothetical protein